MTRALRFAPHGETGSLWRSGRATLLIAFAVAVVSYLQQSIVAFLLLIVLVGVGSWRSVTVLFRPRTVADRILLAVTVAAAWVAVVSEVLSVFGWLGQPVGWLAAAGIIAVIGAGLPQPPRSPSGLSWAWIPAHPVGRLVLAVFSLHLGAVFFLTWSTGINVGDSIAVYLPRSVRYIQYGTVAVHDTHFDYMPGLHQVLVAVQLLFLRSDILVVPMSFLIAVAASVAVFACSRSLRLPGHLPLAAAALPWLMPMFLLHASAANFDILTGLWLLLALYFLRRGFAASDHQWLVAAALATALALATKPTFWFAAPMLGIWWLLTLLRAVRRRSVRRTLTIAVWAGAIVAVIGMPFIVRNVRVYGAPLGPPDLRAFIVGEMSLPDRFYLLAFNSLALGYQLLLPPSLLSTDRARESNDRFTALAQSLGFNLPDARLTPSPDWTELVRAALPRHRYDSNSASFGAAFVLGVLPAIVLVPVAPLMPMVRRRLGPYALFAAGFVAFGVGYFLVYGFVYRFQTSSLRLLVEAMMVLAVVAPVWLVLLPRPAHGLLLIGLAFVLIPEMSDVIQHSRWMPPDRVMQTPRAEQIYLFAGDAPPDAARMFERKYPPSALPEVLIHDSGTGHPNFPDYTFLGPTLQRRTRYWVPKPDVLPPGPFLTYDAAVADRLVGAGMIPDRLGTQMWLLLPNDRLRVRMTIVQEDAAAPPTLLLEATAPASEFPNPTFAFFQIDGGRASVLQPFGPKASARLPLSEARKGAIRVEVQDGERRRRTDRVTISAAVLNGL